MLQLLLSASNSLHSGQVLQGHTVFSDVTGPVIPFSNKPNANYLMHSLIKSNLAGFLP
jgi:hypothetical protein